MTTIPPMIRARVDCILRLAANGLRFYVAQPRPALRDGQGSEGHVTNVSWRDYCFVALVSCATAPYIRHLYVQGDLSCKRIHSYSGRRNV
jgi:hypothetical protein